MADGADAMRFIDGITGIFQRIKAEDWEKIDKASSVISDSLLSGHSVYCLSEGHIPPLANSFGTPGNPNFFVPYDLLVGHFNYFPTVPMKGDTLLIMGQFDSSPFVNEVAAKCKVLGAYTIFVGTVADRKVIPLTMPMLSLPQLCDLTIDAFTPPIEGLLNFPGLEVEACPTAGITSILLFHVLNIEVAEKVSRGAGKSGSTSDAKGGPSGGKDAETPLFFRGLAEKR
ncbi:MAG: hypothetical protein OK456_10030 [Thaumarchaeota archaeon]|nr:hypothetical protein [Nitrososphaerota archaeon]